MHPLLLFLLLSVSFLSACDLQQQESTKLPEKKSLSTLNNKLSNVESSQLKRVKKSGILTVLTRYDPTTYYEGANGFSGLEYDLVQLFAKHLAVKAKFILPANFSSILQKAAAGEADFAAAGISITKERQQYLMFAPPYQKISEQLIYRTGTKRPKKTADLTKGILEIVKGTSHEQTLHQLKKSAPQLKWLSNETLDTENLLYLVNERLIDFTIADSNQMALMRRFYPKLNAAYDINPDRKLAWAFRKSDDLSLYSEAVTFFKQITKNKVLAQLLERHYGHAHNIKYVGNCTFRLHLQSRLPEYKPLFMQAAEKNELDWRLLAAVSYQESHWNQYAVSPTGVKGLMMLTQATATQFGIKNRSNPAESIFGGAAYLKQRLKTIPTRIPQPDRTWFALASYNVGYGHVEDARIITQKLGKNPDKWADVKQTLPLLTKKKWYSKTKHGYARGKEPVIYVDNIRNYLDLLHWYTKNKAANEAATMPSISALSY